MDTCEHCREQIWDELFGLLEAEQSSHLHQHIAGCSACQSEMATARTHHRWVTEAARLDVEVPLFTVPEADGAEPVLRPARPETRSVPRRFRALPWLATAAAVLLLIGSPLGLYEYGRSRHEAACRAAEESALAIVLQRDALQLQAQLEREHLVRRTRRQHLRLQVVGPAAYQLAAANPYHVWVTDVAGLPVDAPVTARLVDADHTTLLETTKAQGKGEWLVQLPAHLPLPAEHTPRFELAVRDQKEPAPVQTHLRVLEPSYRTHLTTDKTIYHVGETIFFRSLTLERFGHKMADREFTATYTLSDAQGQEFQTLRGLTKEGIGGGDFEFRANWPAGEYRLTIADADQRFPPATRWFWVRPLVVSNQAKDETRARAVPETPKRLEVEFFPEGGELVADLDNRVYFRVRTESGRPAELQGAILDSQDQEVVPIQTARPQDSSAPNRGLGMFTLRPRAGATYKLRVRSPEGVDVRAPLPPVQSTGLVLSLPSAVVGPEEPMRTFLQQTGPERQLVVGLFCQGRLVAEELVTAKAEPTETRLTPTVACSGVLRVTVFEEREGQLWPLAERLAYRRPGRRLALSVKADKENPTPGEPVKLEIRSRNENGKSEAAWLLVSAVDQAALAQKTNAAEADLPAYFTLTSELSQPEELEQADILLSDSPEAARALDLFLGTQGWRRFMESKPEAVLVQGNAGATRRPVEPVLPTIVKLDNLQQVERSYVAELLQASTELDTALAKRDQELVTKGNERLQAAQAAAQERDAYVRRAGEVLHVSIGLGALVLFVAACLLLAIALVRLARGLAPHRPALVGALGALLLCVLVIWGPARVWVPPSGSPHVSRIGSVAQRLAKRLELAAIALPNNQQGPPSLAFSKGHWPAPEGSEKAVARLQPDPEVERTDPRMNPSSGFPRGQGLFSIQRSSPQTHDLLIPKKEGSVPHLPIRAYAYERSKDAASEHTISDTILWQPMLLAKDGTAEVRFWLPPKAATYQIRVQAHDGTGRLGAIQEKLECRPNASGAAQ